MDNRVNTILDYWFGEIRNYESADQARIAFWFEGNPKTNAEITQLFSSDLIKAANGHLDHWLKTNDGLIALIVLLDQFCRNIHRQTGEAFSCDDKALQISYDAITAERDLQLQPLQRLFLYLPLEHAENLAMQKLCVERFTELLKIIPQKNQTEFQHFLTYAKKHMDVIERFGRFPHRNSLLQRESTADEIEFLKQPDSSFM